MRAVSPRQRRREAILARAVSLGRYPGRGDKAARIARQDAFAILEAAAENRRRHAEGFSLLPAAHATWAEAARVNLRAARTTDLLARNHGFRLPGTC